MLILRRNAHKSTKSLYVPGYRIVVIKGEQDEYIMWLRGRTYSEKLVSTRNLPLVPRYLFSAAERSLRSLSWGTNTNPRPKNEAWNLDPFYASRSEFASKRSRYSAAVARKCMLVDLGCLTQQYHSALLTRPLFSISTLHTHKTRVEQPIGSDSREWLH